MDEGLSLTAPLLSPWSSKWHSQEQRYYYYYYFAGLDCFETAILEDTGAFSLCINVVPCRRRLEKKEKFGFFHRNIH